MYLSTLATANPSHTFTQMDTWRMLSSHPKFGELKLRSALLLEKILTQEHSGIQNRQFRQADLAAVFTENAEELNRSFEKYAPDLACQALQKALNQIDMAAHQVDAVFVCTCTGYLCPGPSSYVAEKMNLRPNTYLCDLVGLGCGAAIPALRAANGYLAAHPSHTAVVIAVEISSAAFFMDDDPGVLISLCLFGDGAAAAILAGQPSFVADRKFHSFDTLHIPQEREKIRFINSAGKLKNQLHRHVPNLAAQAVSELFQKLDFQPKQILAHTGGRDVVDAIEKAIPGYFLAETREVLRRHGNMSSPSVMFALAERMKNFPDPEALWLTAFGAGFAAHSCSLSPA